MSGDYYYCTHFHLLDHPFQLNLSSVVDAQRRPGHQPRRHVLQTAARVGIDHRSTKAGASAPATRAWAYQDIENLRRRSTKAEASAPATRLHILRRPKPLVRSTKAGASAPATHQAARRLCRRLGRSTKAGASAPATPSWSAPMRITARFAQRRPGHQPRRHFGGVRRIESQIQRSTKAGASAPATRPDNAAPWRVEIDAQRRPGHQPRRHAARAASAVRPFVHAQRRPGHQPRRHAACLAALIHDVATLNEGRGISPGDTSVCGESRRELRRSTKAGASAPATPGASAGRA